MANRVRIKICGMTREADIAYAETLGADAIGLIFFQKSPRCISIEQAKKLVSRLPLFVDIVAVFVNPSSEEVEKVLDALPINLLQFHGEESEKFCSQFNKPYIKAVKVKDRTTIKECSLLHSKASAFLLDSFSSTEHGGTGQCFDWRLIPENLDKPLILAGGLKAENVKEALLRCSPYAVDVCSGVEASLGTKDHRKMKQFVEAVWGRT